MFFLRLDYVSIHIRSMIQLKLMFCVWCEVGVMVPFSHMNIPLANTV